MLYRLLQRLDRSLFEPQVIALLDLEGPLKDKIISLNIPVHVINYSQRGFLNSIVLLHNLLKTLKPDVLHTQLFASDIAGRLIGRITGVPVVITSIRSLFYPGRFRDFLIHVTERLSDRTTIVSNAAYRRFVDKKIIPEEKLIVILSGIDPDCYYHKMNANEKKIFKVKFDLPIEAEILFSAGSLTIQKGHKYLLEAFKIVNEKNDYVILVIAGEGELENELKLLTERLQVADRIIFLGRSDDIPSLLAASDIYISSSIREGLPGSILEAMASELPVVATSVGGTPELVLDGITGFLVPPESPDELAKAIEKVLRLNKEVKHSMGQAGRLRVEEHFHVNRMVREYEDLYLDCLKEKQVM